MKSDQTHVAWCFPQNKLHHPVLAPINEKKTKKKLQQFFFLNYIPINHVSMIILCVQITLSFSPYAEVCIYIYIYIYIYLYPSISIYVYLFFQLFLIYEYIYLSSYLLISFFIHTQAHKHDQTMSILTSIIRLPSTSKKISKHRD